jgi:hypothetical protein
MKVSIPGFFNLLFFFLPAGLLTAQYSFDFELLKEAKLSPVAEINTFANDAAPVLSADKLFFISDRNENVYDIFHARYEKGYISDIKSLGKNINSSQHEGPACMCGEKLYFSRSVKRKLNGIKSDGIQLMSVKTIDEKPSELNTTKNLMHLTCFGNNFLAVELDQNKMTNIVRTGKGGEIINDDQLKLVNSNSHDVFPVLIKDSVLVFSSKRPEGYGGLDFYISGLTESGWSRPVVLPPPFNTPYDDFGLILFADGRSGMLSSNRPGGQGGDDVYYWSVSKPFIKFQPEITFSKFELTLLDKLSDEPVNNGFVKLYQVKDNKALDQLKRIRIENFSHEDTVAFVTISNYVETSPVLLQLNEMGVVTAQLPSDQHFVLEIMSATYERLFYLFTSEQWTQLKDLTLPLSPLTYVNEEKDLMDENVKVDTFVRIIKGITFGTSNLSFNPESQKMIEEVLVYGKENRNSKMEIISYTSTKENSVQAQNKTTLQAAGLKKWLIFNGLKAENIISKGGGDTKILNRCVRGMFCSDDEHLENDRVEVRIWNNNSEH